MRRRLPCASVRCRRPIDCVLYTSCGCSWVLPTCDTCSFLLAIDVTKFRSTRVLVCSRCRIIQQTAHVWACCQSVSCFFLRLDFLVCAFSVALVLVELGSQLGESFSLTTYARDRSMTLSSCVSWHALVPRVAAFGQVYAPGSRPPIRCRDVC